MNLNKIDALALQERLQIEKQIEAEVSASADAQSNTPSWWRIRQCDQLYIEQLVLQLSAMAHGKAVAIDWNQFERVRTMATSHSNLNSLICQSEGRSTE